MTAKVLDYPAMPLLAEVLGDLVVQARGVGEQPACGHTTFRAMISSLSGMRRR